MRKIKLLLVIIVITSTVSAQNPILMNAFNYLRKGKIDKAKEAIDAASEHPDTKDKASTWFYKGNIYLAISASPDEAINNLDTLALEKSYEYYQKSLLIDKEISNDMLNISNPFDGIKIVADEYFRKGQKAFKEKRFFQAFNCFDKSVKYKDDPNAAYMAAISASNYEISKDPKKDTISLAKETKAYLKDLTNKGFKDEYIYNLLATTYMNEKDTAKAISVANKAEKQFADSTNTMILKFNVYYWAGKTAEASTILQKIKDKDPKNPIIHFNIGTILEKTNFVESEKAYLTAIDLKPDYFDAIFNLGALYFNKFIELKKQSSDMYDKDPDQSDKISAESKTYLTKARPIVEKCYQLNPKERATVFMLKQIYANSNELDKAKEMDKIYQDLKK
jgi:tetratricopeptide (TPR) repeat protein